MANIARPVGEEELQAWVDGRLTPERSEAVEAYLAAHPEERARLSQYAEQRRALRAAFTEQETPPPARLGVARRAAVARDRLKPQTPIAVTISGRTQPRAAAIIARDLILGRDIKRYRDPLGVALVEPILSPALAFLLLHHVAAHPARRHRAGQDCAEAADHLFRHDPRSCRPSVVLARNPGPFFLAMNRRLCRIALAGRVPVLSPEGNSAQPSFPTPCMVAGPTS
jgi:anti-sigma factor RsiW